MTLAIGTRLGHYRIVALLGRGGMSDVYLAADERLGREVALKAVPPEFARYPERVKRFEREVRAAAGLTHANIVTVSRIRAARRPALLHHGADDGRRSEGAYSRAPRGNATGGGAGGDGHHGQGSGLRPPAGFRAP